MELADEFAALTRQKRELEEAVGGINDKLAELQAQILALHESSGVGSSVKLASGGTLVIAEKLSAKKADEGALITWLDAHQMSDIAKRSVNANTLAALCRERAEKGEAVPDGVEIGMFKQVTWRK